MSELYERVSMSDPLSTALRLYTGRGVSAHPRQDRAAVLGSAVCRPFLTEIEQLLDEVGELRPDWNGHSLASASEWAKAEIKARHPELADDALDTLAWSFSYDHK
jgi:hypothetical protein